MKKTKKPIIALMYDFDKTLCTTDMQNYELIPALGVKNDAFWDKATALAEDADAPMDRVLAYMYQILRSSKAASKPVRRENFVQFGSSVRFFNGVTEWFGRINEFGKSLGVQIEHYIISSGLKEIIEGTSIAHEFKRIYACEFHYDENGVADWPAVAVNFTGKTQFLYRINKQALELWDDRTINQYVPENERPVPFRNMIYFGDGVTDVPCMKLVKVNGGCSIGVYSGRKPQVCEKLIGEGRVDFVFKADYAEGGDLDACVKDVITQMASKDKLVRLSLKQKYEKSVNNKH